MCGKDSLKWSFSLIIGSFNIVAMDQMVHNMYSWSMRMIPNQRALKPKYQELWSYCGIELWLAIQAESKKECWTKNHEINRSDMGTDINVLKYVGLWNKINSLVLFPWSVFLQLWQEWNVNENDILVWKKAHTLRRTHWDEHQTKSCEFNNKHDMKNMRFY